MAVKGTLDKVISVMVGIISIILPRYFSESNKKYSLNLALEHYGFGNPKQKQAIEDLFAQSSIIPKDSSLNAAFPERLTKDEVIKDIIYILKETQKKFVVRSGVQERWETEALEWMTQNKLKTYENLKILGFVDAVAPKHTTTDALCILGATASRMAGRIDYASSLIKDGLKTKAIILLTGERYVTKNIDGSEIELIQIANKYNLTDWTKLNETHIIKDLYDKSDLKNSNLAVHVIDTPKGNLPRPTTQTTVLDLIKWLKTHDDIQNITFVSNQPNVPYQSAIIDSIFKDQHVDIKYEVVGNESANIEELRLIIEGFGSYIWAATPSVLLEMHLQLTDLSIKESLKELYSKNPLLYNTLPDIFSE